MCTTLYGGIERKYIECYFSCGITCFRIFLFCCFFSLFFFILALILFIFWVCAFVFVDVIRFLHGSSSHFVPAHCTNTVAVCYAYWNTFPLLPLLYDIQSATEWAVKKMLKEKYGHMRFKKKPFSTNLNRWKNYFRMK